MPPKHINNGLVLQQRVRESCNHFKERRGWIPDSGLHQLDIVACGFLTLLWVSTLDYSNTAWVENLFHLAISTKISGISSQSSWGLIFDQGLPRKQRKLSSLPTYLTVQSSEQDYSEPLYSHGICLD
jgi:hypothetical protein